MEDEDSQSGTREPLLETGLKVGLTTIVLLLIASGALVYRNLHTLYEDYDRVAHSWEVLEVVEEVASTMKDAETGQRGYLITGEESYLVPYHDATASIRERVERLKKLTENNPKARASIPTLERLISAKLGELEETVTLRRRDFEAARRVVLTNRGKASMEAIRAQVDEIKELYLDLLQNRQQRATSLYWVAVTSTISATLLGLGMVGAFSFLLRRHLLARYQAELEIKAVNDSLERRVAERTAEAEGKTRQLRQMSAKLVQVEQSERRRLSQALHDNLQQLLVAAKLMTDRLRDRLRDPVDCQLVDDVIGLLEESVGEARSLTVELSPPVLYEAGLAAGLKWLGGQMRHRHGLEVEVVANRADEPGDESTRAFLFEAVRELLFNVVKHARASKACVSMARTADGTRIEVNDDGVGVAADRFAAAVETNGGFGLFSIRERLEVLNGRMSVESRPGQGTSVAIVVPARMTSS